jgi:hypothetical protein
VTRYVTVRDSHGAGKPQAGRGGGDAAGAGLLGAAPVVEDPGGADHGIGVTEASRGLVEAPVDEGGAPREAARRRIESGRAEIFVDARPAIGAGRVLHHADLGGGGLDDGGEQDVGSLGDGHDGGFTEQRLPGQRTDLAVHDQLHAGHVGEASLEQAHRRSGLRIEDAGDLERTAAPLDQTLLHERDDVRIRLAELNGAAGIRRSAHGDLPTR